MLIFSGLLAATLIARGQNIVGAEEFDPLGEHLDLPRQVRIITEYFEVSQETATAIFSEERNGANDSDLRTRVLEMVKKKEARVIDSASVTTRSGQRAKMEAIEEVIYPTEYDPPETAASSDGKSKMGGFAPPNPTAFEMRPVGITLEVDPVIGADGFTVEVNIAPEIVYENEPTVLAKWKTKEAEAEVTEPVFYSLKLSTAISLITGQPHMAAVLSPRNEKTGKRDSERKVLVFVRADILIVGK